MDEQAKWEYINALDEELLNKPEYVEEELEGMARIAIRALLQTIYLEQGI